MITLDDLAFFLHMNPEDFRFQFRPEIETFLSDKKISPAAIRQFLQNYGRINQPQILTIAALKGGIGKTFLSTHAAVRLSMLGMRVLLVDLDPEACASNSLAPEEHLHSEGKKTIYDIFKEGESLHSAIIPTKYEGLDIIPSSLRVSKTEKLVSGQNPKTLLKKHLEHLDYDFIFLELPPSFSTLCAAAYLSSDTIVIPCTPNIHALESVDLTIEAVKEVATEFECQQMKFQVLFNMYQPKRNASQDVLRILQDDYGDILLPYRIPDTAEIQNAINAGVTIYESKVHPKIRRELDGMVRSLCPALTSPLAIQRQSIQRSEAMDKLDHNGYSHLTQ